MLREILKKKKMKFKKKKKKKKKKKQKNTHTQKKTQPYVAPKHKLTHANDKEVDSLQVHVFNLVFELNTIICIYTCTCSKLHCTCLFLLINEDVLFQEGNVLC